MLFTSELVMTTSRKLNILNNYTLPTTVISNSLHEPTRLVFRLFPTKNQIDRLFRHPISVDHIVSFMVPNLQCRKFSTFLEQQISIKHVTLKPILDFKLSKL